MWEMFFPHVIYKGCTHNKGLSSHLLTVKVVYGRFGKTGWQCHGHAIGHPIRTFYKLCKPVQSHCVSNGAASRDVLCAVFWSSYAVF